MNRPINGVPLGLEGARVHAGSAPAQPAVQGVILAGGYPRGDSVLDGLASPLLLPISARPLWCYTLSWLREAGTSTVTVCANSRSADLCRCFGDGRDLGVSLHYFEDLMPRGPAGCAKDAAICPEANVFVVIEGTVLPRLELAKVLEFHQASEAVLTVVANRRHAPGQNGQQALEPAGIYVFSKAALEHIPEKGYQDIKEGLIPQLYRAGKRITTYQVDSSLALRVMGAASYLEVSKWMVERIVRNGKAPDGYARQGEALVHKAVRLDPTVQLIGPAMIEPGCVLESGSMIIGPTVVGEGCMVNRGAIVSRSTLWRDCSIGAGAMVDRCILTDGSEVDSGRVVVRESIGAAPRRRRFGNGRRISSVLWRWQRNSGGTGPRSAAVDTSFFVGDGQSYPVVNPSRQANRCNLRDMGKTLTSA